MLTVQETLKTVDPNELISSYAIKVFSAASTLLNVPDNMTFGEYLDNKRHNASIIIDNLLNAKIEKESSAILLVCHRYDEGAEDIAFELVEMEDISADNWKDRAQGYCYMAEPFEEIASYKIADTYLTQRNLIPLLTDVIYETSWFGPNQEGREEFIESLKEATDNIEEAKPINELFKKFEEDFGWTPEIRDENEEAEERKVQAQIYQYNRFCFLNQIDKLRTLLHINEKGE